MFRENNIEFENVNYFTDELTEDKLRDLLKKASLTPFEVLRKNETAFKENRISAETSPDEVIKLIVKNPSLLQRPIVEVGDKAVLARPVEKALDLIKSGK
ncbi:MAG: ArsC/Spx/MgsR family protein [Pyrinomonadaceae bacterium]